MMRIESDDKKNICMQIKTVDLGNSVANRKGKNNNYNYIHAHESRTQGLKVPRLPLALVN